MKDIKTKPKSTTMAVQNAPKSVRRSPAETVKNIKTAAKDTLVRNAVDKQLETKQSNELPRAEIEATEQVERAYYSASDTVYQKDKSFAENKLKQHRQHVKTRGKVKTPIFCIHLRTKEFRRCKIHLNRAIIHLKLRKAYKQVKAFLPSRKHRTAF